MDFSFKTKEFVEEFEKNAQNYRKRALIKMK